MRPAQKNPDQLALLWRNRWPGDLPVAGQFMHQPPEDTCHCKYCLTRKSILFYNQDRKSGQLGISRKTAEESPDFGLGIGKAERKARPGRGVSSQGLRTRRLTKVDQTPGGILPGASANDRKTAFFRLRRHESLGRDGYAHGSM